MPSADHGLFAAFLKSIIQAFPEPAPAYCVIGALAVTAWGQVRSTRDIDLLVLSEEPGRTQLIDGLMTHGFVPDTEWAQWNPLAKDAVLRFTHQSHPGLPLDLLFAVDSHAQSTITRRKALNLLGILIWVCSPEDLIMLKLKAGRPHDFEDALGIVKNPELQLDLSYLKTWANRLGVAEELKYVLNTAG